MNTDYLFPGREDLFRLKVKNTESLKAEIMTVKDGIILPHLYGHNDSGGVCDAERKFLQESLCRGEYIKRGGEYGLTISAKLQGGGGGYYTEKALFLGYFVKHWGHFLIDGIGRFWILCNEEYRNHKVIFLTDEFTRLSGSYLELFRYLGVDESRLISIRKPTRFDEIIIPSTGYNAHGNYSPEHKRMLQQVIQSSGACSIDTPRKIYLTRTHFKDARMKEVGEKNIEQIFANNGWAVMSPEKLSLREQIAIFQNAEEVACVNGTIPLNVIFARPGLKLIVLNKTRFQHGNLQRFSCMAGIDPVYVDAYYEPFRGIPDSLGGGPFWMVISDCMKKYFADNNMNFDASLGGVNIAGWIGYLMRLFRVKLRGTKFWLLLRFIKRTVKKAVAKLS